ncbi:hypothetical protein ACIU1J_05750 [Azospirillum doebereinerae]|uniref:hypothetical protein n=1 Tax=Azospirillum doebereinerae TaxID=92933 RepID=UPI00384C5837
MTSEIEMTSSFTTAAIRSEPGVAGAPPCAFATGGLVVWAMAGRARTAQAVATAKAERTARKLGMVLKLQKQVAR